MEFATASATVKTPDTDTEPTSPSDPKSSNFLTTRSFSFTNGALKPHQYRPVIAEPQPTMVVAYKECLKNHAASLGGHALDGCGEFMPSPASNPMDPTSLKCAACGCHRNFHRRDQHRPARNVLNHLPRRRLLPAPTAQTQSPSLSLSPSSSPGPTLSPQSPPPVSHLPPSYFASPPQMLLALSTGFSAPSDERNVPIERKRSRTKFTQDQKEKMSLFAEKVGWRMHKADERLVEEFCNEIGIRRGVFKVWMHNNKHSLKKRSGGGGSGGGGGGGGGPAADEQNLMMNNNVKYEIRDGCDSIDTAEMNTNYNVVNVNVNANPQSQNEGSRASFHLSNNGSSSSS